RPRGDVASEPEGELGGGIELLRRDELHRTLAPVVLEHAAAGQVPRQLDAAAQLDTIDRRVPRRPGAGRGRRLALAEDAGEGQAGAASGEVIAGREPVGALDEPTRRVQRPVDRRVVDLRQVPAAV